MGRILQVICAVVVAAGLTASAKQADQTGRQQDAEGANAVGSASPAPPIPPQTNATVHDPGCEQGQDNRQSDLCAQWEAVDAARSSAEAAWVLGIIGIMIGGLTLLAAMSAARWAKQAAINAGNSATIASDALIADTRAWLAIKSVSVWSIGTPGAEDNETLSTQVTVWVHNYGRGPSLDCEVEVGWKRKGQTWESVEYAPYCVKAKFDTLMPEEGNNNIVVTLHDPMSEVFLDGMLILWVSVTYRIVGAGLRKRTSQTLKVGAPKGDGIQPVGIGFLSRGGRLVAVPAKTAMD
jgi:hypothetical protein